MKKSNNKLSMKDLQMQIDSLQKSMLTGNKDSTKPTLKKVNDKAPTSTEPTNTIDVKSTVTINPLKSSLIILYILSWIGFLANKLPILSKLSPILKKMLGKTPFWTSLIFMRKGFVIFNALIAMYGLMKLTGLDQGSFMGAFVGMGTVYVEILSNFISKSFAWFLDLFDMKIVPQLPKDKPNFPSFGSPSGGYGWTTKPMTDNNYIDIAEKAKSWYTSPPVESQPSWYRDWSWTTLFYVVGGVLVIVGGIMVYSYFTTITSGSSISNPDTYLKDIRTGTPPPAGGPSSSAGSAGGGGAAIGKGPELKVIGATPPETGAANSVAALIGTLFSPVKYLNPFNQVPPYLTPEQAETFRNSNETRLTVYPHQPVDQTQPWYTRMRQSILGETATEAKLRNMLISEYFKDINVTDNRPSPIGSLLGIRELPPSNSPAWVIHMLNKLPPTPKHNPLPNISAGILVGGEE